MIILKTEDISDQELQIIIKKWLSDSAGFTACS